MKRNALSELNDTVVEAQLRTRQVPPLLPTRMAIELYRRSKNRLLILGFNATLTEPVESSGIRGGDQIKEMELNLHPELKVPLATLCDDSQTTVVVLSGSDRSVLDDNFGEFNMWLAAENGMFSRLMSGEWMTTMPEHLNMDWVDSVKHVFEYFTERKPRSHFEHCETSLVWNYKYAVGRKRSNARYLLNSSDEVVCFLKELAEVASHCYGSGNAIVVAANPGGAVFEFHAQLQILELLDNV